MVVGRESPFARASLVCRRDLLSLRTTVASAAVIDNVHLALSLDVAQTSQVRKKRSFRGGVLQRNNQGCTHNRAASFHRDVLRSCQVNRQSRPIFRRSLIELPLAQFGRRLIEAESGAHLWAERFDKPVADLFDMQDEIVARLASRLGQELVRAEARWAHGDPGFDGPLFPWDGLLQQRANPRSSRQSAVPLRPRSRPRSGQCRRVGLSRKR
jgi:hypothetical protein